jgi:hypothetical protein
VESGGKNMKKLFLYIFVALAVAFIARAGYFMYCNATYEPQDGDVILHVSESSQSKAIKVGTLSRYSHCGVIIMKNNKPYVLEAENGVELTPMNKWLKRGKMFHHYRVMRLKDEQPLKLSYQLGGRYDRAFRFGNGKYYCSELVWEIYKKQNKIELCEPRLFGDYHFLSLPVIQKQIKSRGFDLEQRVVAPSDIVSSSKLKTVSYGYGNPFWLN